MCSGEIEAEDAPETEKEGEEAEEEKEENAKEKAKSNSLFIYNLESFSALEKFLSITVPVIPFITHPTMDERVNAHFRHRSVIL